jgi:hypothetical protein
MKLTKDNPDFYCYDVYLGAEVFSAEKKGKVLEASEEDGYIIYEPKIDYGNFSRQPKREFGKVYIVRVR